MNRETLTDHDRRIVRETAEEVRAAPSPATAARFGLPAALLGLVIVLGWPRVRDAVPGGDFVSPIVLLMGILLLLGGPAVMLMNRGGGHSAARAAVEAALRRLEDPRSDRETALRAATVLLIHAYVQAGPTTAETFDPDELAPRIGSRLPLVVAVEEHLVERSWAYPVFTLASDEG